jgi:hypothetical protein
MYDSGSRRQVARLRCDRRRLALPLALWLVLQLPASAADITVGGGCTLVEAIKAANTDTASGGCPAGSGPDDVILTGDVTLTAPYSSSSSGLPEVTTPIVVKGNDFEVTRVSASSFRIFSVDFGGVLALENTTISNGGGPGFNYDFGGGIYAFGTVTLTNSTVSGCSAYYGGGIATAGGFVGLENSTLSGNSAINTGGGINSEFGTITLVNSTVSGNTAGYGYGGGINANGSSVNITNSTFSGNTGAISGSATVLNSLLAHSIGANCSAVITDGGNNLATDSSCGAIPGGLTYLDPVLRDNGGPTLTHELLAASNARDRAGNCGLATDQRGVPRDDGACDSGSFEVETTNIVEIKDTTITSSESYEGEVIHLGPNLTVMGPSGSLTVTAETEVVFFNEVVVLIDGELTARLAPTP